MVTTYRLFDKNGKRLKKHIIQTGGSNRLTDKDITEIYNTVSRSDVYDAEKKTGELVASTYGEILVSSVDKLIEKLIITSDDVFYDLGSGAGKLVMQMHTNSEVGIAKGVEFQPNRYKIAEKALKKMYNHKPELLNDERIISYYNGNIINFDLNDATIIFMCSTCFPEELMDVVLEKVRNNSNIKYIISLKDHDNFKQILPNKETLNLPMTWSSNTNVNIYSK